MGMIYSKEPRFLTGDARSVKFHKLMFIRKGGRVKSKNGDFDFSRDYLNAELICVSNEDANNWIGNYAEGLGFFDIRFAKEDCREASDEEVAAWMKDNESVKF